MDALGLGASRSNIACGSIQDLQGQLHQLLAAKTTDTRAEHLSASLEIQPHAPLHLVSDSQNGAIDGADPAQSQLDTPITKTVLASETLQNQSADDPALQRAVAGLISGALGSVDGSTWLVEQVTRAANGWQFAYICKDSLQAWNRAHAKTPHRHVIGSYSNIGSLDSVNLSRPAFDCRGTLSIAFYTSSRGIVIKYEHTSLHKTVTQLVERLEPAPIPAPSNNGNQRTPKPARPRRTHRASQAPLDEDRNEESGRKKRRRTTSIPEVEIEDAPQEHQNTHQNATASASPAPRPGPTGALNVSAAEAERRRKMAVQLLLGKGIDPGTLSPEQFSIFANQAPSLQTTSLEMLAKYGAERLRIVHPEERGKEQAAPSDSTAATAPAPSTSPAPAVAPAPSTAPTTPTGPAPTTAPEPASVPAPSTAIPLPGSTTSKPRITRGRCFTCRQRHAVCTKEHPSCSTCINAQVECVYLPPRRRKSKKSEGFVEKEPSNHPEEDDAEDVAENRGPTPAPDLPVPDLPGPAVIDAGQSPPDMESGDSIADRQMLSETVEHQTVEHQTVEHQTIEHQTIEHQSIQHQPIEQPVEHQPVEHQPVEYQLVEHQSVGYQPIEHQSVEHHTVASQPVQHHQPLEHQPVEHQAVERQTVGHQTATTQPVSTNGAYYEQSGSGINFLEILRAQAAAGAAAVMSNFPYSEIQTSGDAAKPTSGISLSSTPVQPQQPSNLPGTQRSPGIAFSSTSVQPQRPHSLPAAQPAPNVTPNVAFSSRSMQPQQPRSSPVAQPAPSVAYASRSVPQQQPRGLPAAQPVSAPAPDHRKQSPFASSRKSLPAGQSSQTSSPPTTMHAQAPSWVSLPSANHPTNVGPKTIHQQAAKRPKSRKPRADPNQGHDDQQQMVSQSPQFQSSMTKSRYESATTHLNPVGQSHIPQTGSPVPANSRPLPQPSFPTTTHQPASSTMSYSAMSNPATTSGWYSRYNSNTNEQYSDGGSENGSSRVAYETNSYQANSTTTNQNTPYNQSQPQSYRFYSSQQPSANQLSQQNWYGFTGNNVNSQASYGSNQQSSYSSHGANTSVYSSQYSGNNERATFGRPGRGPSGH
ncbi:hypothetical protein F4861DRAFT_5110 [Xylaria intraflava]|nr:hypothetical protein F4861DRAFT_5110 [Xylaria intraflava]